jgi:hypothetical protein
MSNLTEELINEFKKIKHVRGNLFNNFIAYANLCLTGKKDDKYRVEKMQILEYIVTNKQYIKLKLIQN